MDKTILICTVGGSHQPILTAIRQNEPGFVCFICSDEDPVTGDRGSSSRIQIEGKGSVIKKHQDDEKPTLPSIPVQAKLDETQYEVITVPADDPGEAFTRIRQGIEKLAEQNQEASFIADYTGGTKSMSVALALAAVEEDRVDLQLVTGARTNLRAVTSGLEASVPAKVETVRVQRAIERCIGAWQDFSYGEAARGLAGIDLKQQSVSGLVSEVRMLQKLSEAFDYWDRFDHESAESIINTYRPRIAPAHEPLLGSIKTLTVETDRREPVRLWDLWLNAERRARQERFDDAVARLYRLLEWTAQWILRVNCNIKTDNVSPEEIPAHVSIRQNEKGRGKAGLINAWELIEHHLPDRAAGQFAKKQLASLRDQISLRNDSILAHGFQPVDEQRWQKFEQWTRNNFLELLEHETKKAGLRSRPQQLPQHSWPEIEPR